jgi:hypothetical protein
MEGVTLLLIASTFRVALFVVPVPRAMRAVGRVAVSISMNVFLITGTVIL